MVEQLLDPACTGIAGVASIARRAFDGDFAAVLDANFFRNAHLDALADRDGHALGDLVGHAALDRVRHLLADGVGHLFVDHDGFHVANGVGHLLDTIFRHGSANGVRHFLDAGFFDHAAGGAAHIVDDLGAFLEVPAGAFAIVALAGGVNIGAAEVTGHRVRDLLLDDFLFHSADRIGDLLHLGLAHRAADGIVHLLDDGVGDFLANGVGDLFVHAFLDVGRHGNLLAHDVALPHLTAAGFRGAFADDLAARCGLVAGLAGARIEAAFAGNAFPVNALRAPHAVGLGDPFAALLLHGPRAANGLADGMDAILEAGLRLVR